MLFSITTQPRLAFLNKERSKGRMLGIQILDTLNLCKCMFADDIGILIPATQQSFIEVEDSIAVYERAFGAKLNMHKSTIIPIGLADIPQWLTDKRCVITKEGKILQYQGAPLGTKISLANIQSCCLDWVGKCIASRSGKGISFAGKLILIPKVLAIPVYHLIYSYFLQGTSLQLQRVCKDFF